MAMTSSKSVVKEHITTRHNQQVVTKSSFTYVDPVKAYFWIYVRNSFTSLAGGGPKLVLSNSSLIILLEHLTQLNEENLQSIMSSPKYSAILDEMKSKTVVDIEGACRAYMTKTWPFISKEKIDQLITKIRSVHDRDCVKFDAIYTHHLITPLLAEIDYEEEKFHHNLESVRAIGLTPSSVDDVIIFFCLQNPRAPYCTRVCDSSCIIS